MSALTKTAATLLFLLGVGVLTASAGVPGPEQAAMTPHWPWWLRIVAVLAVLIFVRTVARAVRRGPGEPGPK